MTNDEMKKNIVQLHSEMRLIILKSGIQSVHYDSIVKYLDQLKHEQLNEVLSFLKKIKENEYTSAEAIRRDAGTEELWERYDLMEVQGLPEQIIFAERAKILRLAFIKGRPRFNVKKKKSNSNKEDTSGIGVQSKNTGTNEPNCGSG